jgi:hypothetical protein
MKLERTQIYLPSGTRRRLGKDAAERGVSMTAFLREVVEEHYARRSAVAPSSFENLIGCVDDAPAGDVSRDGDTYRDTALADRLRKKLGTRRRATRPA